MDVAPGFLWITEILNSGYPEDTRHLMAGPVVQLLGKHLHQEVMVYSQVRPTEVPPLLDFLSLYEKFCTTTFCTLESQPHPGSIALRILSDVRECADFGPTILPVLSLTLLPTHPLQSRSLALKAFHRLMPWWFSTQVQNVLYKDLDKLLQAVDDPFQLGSTPPRQDCVSPKRPYREAMYSMVALIEFASSNLWQNHLRRSNFTSCEEVLSTEEGRRTAIRCMLHTAQFIWQAFLHAPAKIIATIRRLEELQCLNTAEVVIMWAWTAGVVDAVDHDGWGLVGDDTFRFYQTHGMGRLAALKRHITDTTMESEHLRFLRMHYESPPCRMGSVKRPIPFSRESHTEPRPTDWTDLRVSRVCQLRRLYHLFGYDLVTWKEKVAAEEGVVTEGVDEKMDVSPGHPIPLVNWACDYP